jgi:hypothetical protein
MKTEMKHMLKIIFIIFGITLLIISMITLFISAELYGEISDEQYDEINAARQEYPEQIQPLVDKYMENGKIERKEYYDFTTKLKTIKMKNKLGVE